MIKTMSGLDCKVKTENQLSVLSNVNGSSNMTKRVAVFTDGMSFHSDGPDRLEAVRKVYAEQSILGKKLSTREYLLERLRTAKIYLEQNFNNQINLDQLARHSAMSKFHFLRNFNYLYGHTPYQYLLLLRLDYARFLIKNHQFSVDEVAHKSGFNARRSFSKAYKSKFGKSPSADIVR